MTPQSGGRSAQPGLMPLQTVTMMGKTLRLQSPARLLPRPSQQISSSACARLSWMKTQTAMRPGMRPKGLQVGTHLVGMLTAALHPRAKSGPTTETVCAAAHQGAGWICFDAESLLWLQRQMRLSE